MAGSRRPVVIDPDLSALARTFDSEPFSPGDRDAVETLAENLEALALETLEGPTSGDRIALMGLWLALCRLYAQRGLIRGDVAGAVAAEIFEATSYAGRITATLISQRRSACREQHRRLGQ